MTPVICSRCGQVICHLDYDPGPSIHIVCPDPNKQLDPLDEEEL